MVNEVITRGEQEGPVSFMERVADIAKVHGHSIDAGMGPVCPRCAPFSATDDITKAEILPYAECYNCHYADGSEKSK